MFINCSFEFEFEFIGRIDIWFLLNDGGLMLEYAKFLKQSSVWRDCELRVLGCKLRISSNIIKSIKHL